MEEREITLRAVQQRVDRHNELADKYATQIEKLRLEAATEAEIWEVLLSQMFLQSALAADPRSAIQDPLLQAALEFGLQCMGVGTVLAMDGLAQERITI